jgi:hypothetical protein
MSMPPALRFQPVGSASWEAWVPGVVQCTCIVDCEVPSAEDVRSCASRTTVLPHGQCVAGGIGFSLLLFVAMEAPGDMGSRR